MMGEMMRGIQEAVVGMQRVLQRMEERDARSASSGSEGQEVPRPSENRRPQRRTPSPQPTRERVVYAPTHVAMGIGENN